MDRAALGEGQILCSPHPVRQRLRRAQLSGSWGAVLTSQLLSGSYSLKVSDD